MQKGQVLIWIIVGALIIAVSGGALIYTNYSNNRNKTNYQNPVVTSPASPAKRGEQIPQPNPSPSQTPTSNIPDVIGYTKSSSVAQRPYVYNWMTATTEEKEGWNTYKDSLNGFTLQYPKEWRQQIWEQSQYVPRMVILTSDPVGIGGGRLRGIYITIYPDKDYKYSIDYAKNEILTPTNGFIIKNQPAYFSAIDATVVDGIPGAGSPGPVVYIHSKNNTIIELFSDSLNDNSLVSKIFSTFKFL